MKLTAQIAAAYFGSELMMSLQEFSTPTTCTMIGISHNGLFDTIFGRTKTSHSGWDKLSECKLILKPLSAILEEDAIVVNKILCDSSDQHMPFDEVPEWLDEIFSGNCATTADYVSGREFQSLIDYLRSRGYDCGYGEIRSLIDAGIAVKPEGI